MTLDQFLVRLRKLPVEWKITPRGFIRTKKGSYCPIVAVARSISQRNVRNTHAYVAGYAIGLNADDRCNIIYAADRRDLYRLWLLRERLLHACRLKEKVCTF